MRPEELAATEERGLGKSGERGGGEREGAREEELEERE